MLTVCYSQHRAFTVLVGFSVMCCLVLSEIVCFIFYHSLFVCEPYSSLPFHLNCDRIPCCAARSQIKQKSLWI